MPPEPAVLNVARGPLMVAPPPPPAAAAAFSLAAAALLPSALSPPFLDDARDDGPFRPFEPPDDSPDENSSQWSGDGVDAARVTPPSATPRGEFNPKLFESSDE